MPEREFNQFYIDFNFLLSIADDLEKSGATVDRGMSRYLRDIATHNEDKPPVASLGMAAVQADLVRPVTTDSAIEQRGVTQIKIGPATWGIHFLRKVLGNLREIICGSKKKPSELGPKAQAYIATIATVIIHKFHVSSKLCHQFSVPLKN
jgi:S1-C subfamily serine protease